MNFYITAFLAFGCLFGLATFNHRHLFSEGPHGPEARASISSKGALAFWVAMSTLLWPILVVSGLNTAWVLAKRRARHPSKLPTDERL
jgi:hypothetical protein